MSDFHRQPIKDLLDRETEKPTLEALYLSQGVATDQLPRAPDVLRQITTAFNRIASRDLDSGTILRYMIGRRKKADWPTLGDKARKFGSVADELSTDELAILRGVYMSIDIPSDNLLFSARLMRQIAHQFAGLAGRHVGGSMLVAIIIAKRKRGLWVRIREAFGDIDTIGG